MVSRVGKANKKGFQPQTETFFCDFGLEGPKVLHQSNCSGSLRGPLQQLLSNCWLVASTYLIQTTVDVPRGPFMENRNERNLLRRAELMHKHRDIIAKSAKWMELERESEFERISKANRAAAVGEQNLLNSNEKERVMKNRLAIRQQLRFSKAARRASHRAVNALKKTVEIADGSSDFPLLTDATSELYGSRTIFEDATGLQLVQETEDDVHTGILAID